MEDTVDLLITIVDATTDGWLEADEVAASAPTAEDGGPVRISDARRRVAFPEFVTTLNLFLGSYCALGRKGKLAVIAFNEHEGGYAWPISHAPGAVKKDDFIRAAVVRKTVTPELLRLRSGSSAMDGMPPSAAGLSGMSSKHASLASSLSLALCFHNRMKKECALQKLRSRIVVFATRKDAPAQYISVINATYSAQSFRIPIDAVILGPNTSVQLQQAAHLTNGIYSEVTLEQHAGLFQFLTTVYLPNPLLRRSLLLPSTHEVDLRASCFCHKRHVDAGWVCSICLSIFCSYKSVCPTCGTAAPSSDFAVAE
jgi:transcription initiation factor TFIIH subunit 3